MSELADYIKLRMKQLKDVRRDYEEGLWVDIARFVNPRRENISQDDMDATKGQRRGKDSYDGTPLGALNTWSDGMQGYLVSESLNWFMSEMSNSELNEMDEVRQWLQEYDRCMYAAFRRSNFYAVLPEWFRDAGSIGTATLYTEEDIANHRAVHICIHPREIYIAENNLGEVDTVYRNFKLTARQAVEKFGIESFIETSAIRQNAKSNPEKEHEFIHTVFPNGDYMPNTLNKRGKKFRSIYLEVSGDIIRDGGYEINPYAVWRFRKNSDEVYGYSPAADAIVEIFSLNQFGKTLVKAAQKSVEPPLNVPAEMRGKVRITPSGYNYYDDPQRIISAIMERINYPVGIDQLERLQKSIEDKYRVEFFLMLARTTKEMTAYETMAKQSEVAVLMGPQVDRLYSEGLKKEFDIVSDIEDRQGNLPPPPAIVSEYALYKPLSINMTLTGPLAQAQKRLFKMQPINAGLNALAPAATMFPKILLRVKEQEMAEAILEAAAFPQDLIRTDEEVAEIEQQIEQQQKEQQALQIAGAAADAVPKLGKKIEPDSVLGNLTK